MVSELKEKIIPEQVRHALSPVEGMCYNREAVEYTVKQGTAPVEVRGTAVAESPASEKAADKEAAHMTEDPSRYCPVCSQRLESRRCKLVCGVCGYYMSCADYY